MIPATCLGKGKLDELKLLLDSSGADLVVFDNNLTPAQEPKPRKRDRADHRRSQRGDSRHLRQPGPHLRSPFAGRAGPTAVLPQSAARRWSHLERIEGGVGAGRGPGETQIETDRRLIDRRIAELKKRLAEVEKRRERTVSARREQMTVSIVGYTNAGKSTLMNALTGSDVYVADKLFATLDTRTRRWQLPKWGEVLLSDTVGFVRNLPHDLVASFRSTLEEARHADLLLHVVDAADPEAEAQIDTVNRVLEEIGVNQQQFADRAQQDGHGAAIGRSSTCCGAGSRNRSRSARRRARGSIAWAMRSPRDWPDGYVDVEIETGAGNGRLLAYLAEHAEIKSREYIDSRVTLVCRIPRAIAERLNEEGTVVTLQNGSAAHPGDALGHNGLAAQLTGWDPSH